MFPRWLSWLFVIFLGYIIVTGNRGVTMRDGEPQKAAREERIAQSYPEMHALIDGDRWKRAINPSYVKEAAPCSIPPRDAEQASSYAILEKEGAGESARCGDTLRLTIQPWNADGSKADPVDATIVMGEQPGLDALLNGMTIHEVRTLVLTTPHEGYKALADLKPGQLQLLTVTRIERGPQAEESSARDSGAP